jgi:hypothetical protein
MTLTTPIQEKKSDAWTSGTTITISGLAAMTAGNTLVIYYGCAAAATGVSSISQTGATWALADGHATGRASEVWYTTALTGTPGTTITLNLSGTPLSAAAVSACLSEWPGQLSLDVASSANATDTTPSPPSQTPTSGREALVVGAIRAGGTISAGPTGGFTALTGSDGPTNPRGFGAYLVANPTSGAYATTWTQSSGTWAGVSAVFLAPAGVKLRPYMTGA